MIFRVNRHIIMFMLFGYLTISTNPMVSGGLIDIIDFPRFVLTLETITTWQDFKGAAVQKFVLLCCIPEKIHGRDVEYMTKLNTKATVMELSGTCQRKDPKFYSYFRINLFEEFGAFLTFNTNLDDVNKQNSKYALNQTTFFYRSNENSDIDALTWIKATSGYLPSLLSDSLNIIDTYESTVRTKRSTRPESIDWQEKGLTTSVKHQGLCGSCWSFATVAAIEGQAIKLFNDTTPLSNQQILDCSSSYGNSGCKGGRSVNSFKYCKGSSAGVESFDSFPYEIRAAQCRYNKSLSIRKVTSYKQHANLTPTQLEEIVATVGPVVVVIKALKPLLLYGGGVYYEPACGTKTDKSQLNHEVLLVGYGTLNGKKFWKLKNSWGTSWGEGGYFRISQERDCGVTTDVIYPVVN